MPTAVDIFLTLLVRAERGEIQRSSIHWEMLAHGFSEIETMNAQAQARSMDYTASDGWGPDKLTDPGRKSALTVDCPQEESAQQQGDVGTNPRSKGQ